MKVLHLIDSLRVGGAQRLLVTYVGQAIQAGLSPVIVSLREKEETPMVFALEELGARITYLPATNLLNVGRFLRLLRLIQKARFDILHTHLTHANILGILCAIFLHLPVVVSIHTVLSAERKSKIRAFLEKFFLRFATNIIAVGENVAMAYRALFPEKVLVLSNAVPAYPPLETQVRLSMRQQLVGDAKAPILIAVGRLISTKGFFDLISAFALIHIHFPDAKLIVIGDGELREELRAETAVRGLQEHLYWLGTRNDVPDLLAMSDIYVSASHWEGLSVAMLEAMGNGLPLVVTDVGDAAKVTPPEAGILVPPKVPEQLARAICLLLADPIKMRRMGDVARERIHAEYDARAWFERLVKVYESAISAEKLIMKMRSKETVSLGGKKEL
jgi:L-malate glycosyltransferase